MIVITTANLRCERVKAIVWELHFRAGFNRRSVFVMANNSLLPADSVQELPADFGLEQAWFLAHEQNIGG